MQRRAVEVLRDVPAQAYSLLACVPSACGCTCMCAMEMLGMQVRVLEGQAHPLPPMRTLTNLRQMHNFAHICIHASCALQRNCPETFPKQCRRIRQLNTVALHGVDSPARVRSTPQPASAEKPNSPGSADTLHGMSQHSRRAAPADDDQALVGVFGIPLRAEGLPMRAHTHRMSDQLSKDRQMDTLGLQ